MGKLKLSVYLLICFMSTQLSARPASLTELKPLNSPFEESFLVYGYEQTLLQIARAPKAEASSDSVDDTPTMHKGSLEIVDVSRQTNVDENGSSPSMASGTEISKLSEANIQTSMAGLNTKVERVDQPAKTTDEPQIKTKKVLHAEPMKASIIQWPHSVALGKPHSGYLYFPSQLRGSEKLSVRKHKNFATKETVKAIEDAVEAVHAEFADTPRLPVGNLSRRDGGRLRPHKSHQNGRDADIAYYQRTGHHPIHLKLASARTIDAPRTWVFLESMIKKGQLEIAFIDYRLQRKLYQYAVNERGWSPEELRDVISYPRGRGVKSTIIRHLKGHADHMHLRFYAPNSVAAIDEMIARHGRKILKPVPIYTRIRTGDSLWKLAKRHRTSVAKLRRWNGRKSTRVLRVGRRIIIGWRRPSLSELKGSG